jgi:predicted MFS family arabinose efflux permease
VQNTENISQHAPKILFNRDFIFAVFAAFFSAAAIHSLTPTLPIYLTRLGSNQKEIGVLVGVFAVATLVSRLFMGKALLMYREKTIMIFGTLLCIATFLASIVLRPFWPFFMIRVLQGTTLACMDTAALAFIIGVIPLAYRTRALAYYMLAPSLGLAIAAPSGMFLINRYGFTTFFLAGAGLSFCAFVAAWRIKGREIAIDQSAAPDRSSFIIDLKIIIPGVIAFLQFFAWGAVSAFFPLYAVDCGVTNPGLFFSAIAIMMIIGRMFGGGIMDTCNKEKFIVFFTSAITVLLVALSFSKTLPLFLIVGSLWGMGTAFFVPISMAYSLDYAGSSSGTSVGTFRILQDLGLGLGPVAMGTVIPLVGYPMMFRSLAFVSFINFCYFQFYVRRRRSAAFPEC